MTPEQQAELPELLRLTAVALGEGWRVGVFLGTPGLISPDNKFRDPLLNGDSRWLECELLIDTLKRKNPDRIIAIFDIDRIAYHSATELLIDHNGNLKATTCWAVLRVAAEIGRLKRCSNGNL